MSVRSEYRECVDLLQSDLYRRESALDRVGSSWRSPLGWEVTLRRDVRGVHATVTSPKGERHFTGFVTAEDLDAVLP